MKGARDHFSVLVTWSSILLANGTYYHWSVCLVREKKINFKSKPFRISCQSTPDFECHNNGSSSCKMCLIYPYNLFWAFCKENEGTKLGVAMLLPQWYRDKNQEWHFHRYRSHRTIDLCVSIKFHATRYLFFPNLPTFSTAYQTLNTLSCITIQICKWLSVYIQFSIVQASKGMWICLKLGTFSWILIRT